MPTPHPDHRAVTPYTRADAITDALLFEVPQRLARQFRFPYPVAVTAVAWFDAVAWDARAEAGKPRPTYQTESGRISELLWAARKAVDTTTTGSHDLEFVIYRVPPTGPHTRALRLTLVLHIHQGDHGETVATIGHPDPPHAGHFHLANHPVTIWPATGFDRDRTGQLHPIVTADILDAFLMVAADVTTEHCADVIPTPDGFIHIQSSDGNINTLRPDDHGRYHLQCLGWPTISCEFTAS